MNKLLGVLLLMFVSTSCFSWTVFGPKNYDECILENMKGVSSDSATMLIENSCRVKFIEEEVDNSKKHEWTLYRSGDESSYYYDKSSITRHGKIVTVDEIVDFNKLHSNTYGSYYSSLKSLEYDCGNMTSRFLSSEDKTGHMGEGVTVYQTGVSPEWKFKKETGIYKRYCSN
jgi:hypothetical protein